MGAVFLLQEDGLWLKTGGSMSFRMLLVVLITAVSHQQAYIGITLDLHPGASGLSSTLQEE